MLRRNQEEIARRAGCAITIKMVADKEMDKARALVGAGVHVTGDAFEVVDSRDIDIVVELIGGTGIARELILKAIANGKHVVTANKALLAPHGNEIFAAAQKQGVMVAFEAGRRRHPDHQGAARRAHGQPHRMDRRHHQRHEQLHPVGDARERRETSRTC